MIESVGIAAFIVASVTSIGGWIYAIRRNGKESGRLEMTIKQQGDILCKLPCQANPNYGREWGRLMEKVESSEKRLEKIENAVEEIRQNGKRAARPD